MLWLTGAMERLAVGHSTMTVRRVLASYMLCRTIAIIVICDPLEDEAGADRSEAPI